MDEIKAGLQYVFQTRNRLTLALSASGHAGMEACLGNLLEPGETVLIVRCGIWGERAADMATRMGAKVFQNHRIILRLNEHNWYINFKLQAELLDTKHNEAVSLEELETALKNHRPVAVFMVHAESSTGLKQPLEGFGDLAHKYEYFSRIHSS